MTIIRTFTYLAASVCAILFSGCATHITTDITQNPPPREKFSAFSDFELQPVAMAPLYVGKGHNDQALKKIQENVSSRMGNVIAGWNAAGRSVSPKRTLLIRPEVTEIKFINGGARFWAGPIAGSSAIVLKATITEKETGNVIATPTFYARAAAWGGAFSIGATDNVMLVRIAGRLTDYLSANYPAAVGGPSGFEPDKS